MIGQSFHTYGSITKEIYKWMYGGLDELRWRVYSNNSKFKNYPILNKCLSLKKLFIFKAKRM